MQSCSKGSRGLSVPLRVIGIFTDTTISPSSQLRQCPDRYTIRAGRNLPNKEFHYLRTVIYVATLFADKELAIPKQGLIITLLLIQLVAIPGSFLASKLSAKFGNTRALRIEIFLWALVPLAAYFTTTAEQFYVIAALVGLIMGGIQSLSRSTFAKLIPEDTPRTASYFGFYDIVEKLATSLGTFVFGGIIQMTGEMRNSVLFLLILFVIGFILLMRIPSRKIYLDEAL